MILDILLWIIIGIFAGWAVSMLMGTTPQQSALANVAVGILGAIIGGLAMRIYTGVSFEIFSLTSLFVAMLVSVILIILMRNLGRNTYNA